MPVLRRPTWLRATTIVAAGVVALSAGPKRVQRHRITGGERYGPPTDRFARQAAGFIA
jgi:hypothetical protein